MVKSHQLFELYEKRVFEKAVVEGPFRFAAEMPNEACFYYLVEGEAAMYTSQGKIEAKTSEGLVMQCGNYFNDFLASSDGSYCEAIAIHFYPEVLKKIYDKDFPDFMMHVTKIQPLGYEKHKADALLKNYINSLQFYFENPELVSDELLKIKLKELILLLAKTESAEAICNLIAGMFTPLEINIREVVEANIFNNLSIEELASLCSLSLSSFKREFEKHYDTSPAKYIKKRRLDNAARLLKGTQLRISDIAFDCGFNDLAHFSKSFQKEFDASPSEYRLSYLDNSLN